MIVEGGNHNNTYFVAGQAYIDRLKIFMKNCQWDDKQLIHYLLKSQFTFKN